MTFEAGVGIGAFIVLVILIMIGLPVFLSMFIVSFIGFWLIDGKPFLVSQIINAPFAIAENYVFVVIPLFILMGELAARSGLAESAFAAVDKWIGNLRGGLLMATVGANAIFGAVSGSPYSASIACMKIAMPQLTKQKYNTTFCIAAIVTAGTLVSLIPPSTGAVIFCLLTGVSIGRALVAGIIPGIALTLVLFLSIWILGKIYPHKVPVSHIKVTWRERFSALTTLWPILILFLVMIGGIYLGVFPPTVGGAIGAMAALLYALARRVDKRTIAGAFKETAALNCQLFPIMIAGFIFSRLTVLSGIAGYLTDFVVSLQIAPLAVMAVVVVLYLLISFPLEMMPALIITLPVFFPLLTGLGFSPWQLCVALTLVTTLAVFTPPTGMAVYVLAAMGGVNAWEVWREVIPWFIVVFVFLWIIILCPPLSEWLPNLMYK